MRLHSKAVLILSPCLPSMLAGLLQKMEAQSDRFLSGTEHSQPKHPTPLSDVTACSSTRLLGIHGSGFYSVRSMGCVSQSPSRRGEPARERRDKDRSRPGVSAALDVTSALRPLCRV
ncbi:hypothetical protein V8C34DRAFT_288015 [Trichoderma compactum]